MQTATLDEHHGVEDFLVTKENDALSMLLGFAKRRSRTVRALFNPLTDREAGKTFGIS